MTSRFPIVEETRGLVKKENELCAQIIRNLQTIYDQKIHMAMAYPSLFNFCVEELKMSPSSAQRRCDAVKLSQSVPDLVKKIEDGLVSVSRVAEVSRYIRHEQREAGRVLPPAEVREIFSKAAEVSNDLEARKVLMTQTAAPIHSIPDRRRVVAGGRTVLEFEVDDEFLDLLEAVQNLHSHKGKRKMCEFLKDVFKDQLQYKHPAFKREPKKNIRIQSALPFEQAGYGLNPKREIAKTKTSKTKTLHKQGVQARTTENLEFNNIDSNNFKSGDLELFPNTHSVNPVSCGSEKHEAETLDHGTHTQSIPAVSYGSEKHEAETLDRGTHTQSTPAVSYGSKNPGSQTLDRANNTQSTHVVSCGSEKLDSESLDRGTNIQSTNAVSYGSKNPGSQTLDRADNTQSIPAVSYGSEIPSPQPQASPTGQVRDRKRSRYIHSGIARAVWKRDEARCTHIDPQTGKRCGSGFRIQLDHLRPFSQGGENSLENLVLRCQGHNLYRAGKMGLLGE